MRKLKQNISKWLLSLKEPSLESLKIPFVQWLLGTLVGVITAVTMFYTRVAAIPAIIVDVSELQIKEARLGVQSEEVKRTLSKLEAGQKDIIRKQDRMYEMMFAFLSKKP